MTPTSPPPVPERPGGLLRELLCIDGVTDLHIYRMLTGRAHLIADAEPGPAPASSPECDGQLVLFPVLPCGGDE